jgi:2-oxoglutarate ferredoxin oxidoreductase subunit alpha
MMMMDECVGHMTERVVIPETKEISVVPRRLTEQSPEDYLPYAPRSNLVPEMCRAGDGYRIHTTGLTHDERGYPDMTEKAQDRLVRRLLKKIEANADDIFRLEESWVDDADLIVISYGITSRVAGDAVERARKKELRVGSLRLQTIWPFPEKRIKELASRVSAFVVPEINMGQMVREVERSAAGQARVVSLPLAGGGVHRPEDIVDSLLEARS